MPEVNLTGLQAFHFLLIALAIPVQFFLVKWTGNNDEVSRAHFAANFMTTIRDTVKSYFSWSSWNEWFKELLATALKSKSSLKKPPRKGSEKECIAKEVFQYRDPNGYFAGSPHPRSPRPYHIKYRVGQVIKHRKYGYRGVIVGWDERCRAPEHWINVNHQGHPEYRNKPNYSVLVDSRDRDVQTTYVAEDNIEIVTDTVIKHPQVDEYFDFYDGAQYHMRPALKQMYPYD